jgi:hypothetical protein
MATTTITPGAGQSSGQLIAPGNVAPSAGAPFTFQIGPLRGTRSLVVVIDITAFTSGTLTVTIKGITPAGVVYTILASAALGAAAITTLKVGPGLTASTNVAANDVIPDQIQVIVAEASTPVFTYSVEYLLGV